jgi:hypothetical protein
MSTANMAEPTSSAVGGVVIWKAIGGLLGIGIIASGLGFMVLLPKTPKEAALRAIATMAGSALLGPLFVAAAYSKYPGIFTSGIELAKHFGMEPWLGMFMVAAPLLAMAGLPFWWILGACVLWFDKRKDKDMGEMISDARSTAAKAVAP